MSTGFGVCCLGMLVGMVHGIYASAYHHRSLEDILGHAILYYRILGGIGIASFLLFLGFLISAATEKNRTNPAK